VRAATNGVDDLPNLLSAGKGARQLISRDADTYFLDDKFLELWIRCNFGITLEESWVEREVTANL